MVSMPVSFVHGLSNPYVTTIFRKKSPVHVKSYFEIWWNSSKSESPYRWDLRPTNAASRFFRVKVAMPEE